jgi:hypothetical protein
MASNPVWTADGVFAILRERIVTAARANGPLL